MARRRDITGEKFGRLSVVRLSGSMNKRGERFWECLCDCGNTTLAMLSDLTSAKKQSCGCQKRESTVLSNKRSKSVDPKIRFSEGYEIRDNGCWEWSKGVDHHGYGVLHVNGKSVKAHRFSWELHYGEIPEDDSYHGTMVCHTCDNPRCVNPDHLFLGLASDNVSDMVQKGRNRFGFGDTHGSKSQPSRVARGERAGGAKLTEDQVRQIRTSQKQQRHLAALYGVSEASISMIRHNKIWRHIP